MSCCGKIPVSKDKGLYCELCIVMELARTLQNEIDPSTEIKNHVIVYFLQRYQIRMRSKQRKKKQPKKEKIPKLMKWHAIFSEKIIHTGAQDPPYDQKRGRNKPVERLSIDQSPLQFVVRGKRTNAVTTSH